MTEQTTYCLEVSRRSQLGKLKKVRRGDTVVARLLYDGHTLDNTGSTFTV